LQWNTILQIGAHSIVGKSGKFPSAQLIFLAATANSGYDASAAVITKVGPTLRKFLLEHRFLNSSSNNNNNNKISYRTLSLSAAVYRRFCPY
jgi:hypothetical protein